MEFTFVSEYDQKSMTAMARVLRKTVRKKRSRRSHIFGWVVLAVGLLTVVMQILLDDFDTGTVITMIAMAVMLAVLVAEDRLNGWIAQKKLLSGQRQASTVFTEEGYRSVTEIGETTFHYENVIGIGETAEYFVLIYGKNHGQVYPKAGLTGGTVEEFRELIQRKTGCRIENVQCV